MGILVSRRVLRHPAGVGLSIPALITIVLSAVCVPPAVGQPRARPAAPVDQADRAQSAAPQPKPQPQPQPKPKPPPKPETETPPNWFFLPGPNGTRVPVSAELFREFLRWKASQAARAYDVTSVALDGAIDGDRAVLTARIEIKLHRADEWVRVPLRMQTGNVVLLSVPQHTGAGDDRPDTSADTADGLTWWFRGKGLHTLSFRLSVPVRREHPSRRLLLALPTPPAAGTRLVLRVPQPAVRVTVPERAHAATRAVTGQGTQIEVHGLGDRVDLSWRPTTGRDRNDPVLQAETSITVDLSTDSVVVKAVQLVRTLRGRPETISVLLPPGCRLVDVQSQDIQDTPQVDPEEPERVYLPLIDAAGAGDDRPIEIHWTLEAEFPKPGQPLVISGFDVERARYQIGTIAISTLENYRIDKVSDRYLHHISVSDLPRTPGASLVANRIGSAYEIFRQPFRLELTLQEIKPKFFVEPQLFLKLAEGTAELEVVLSGCRVFRGAVDQFELPWSSWALDGWQLRTEDSPELQLSFDEPLGVLRVVLPEPKTSADDPFTVRLVATCPIPTGEPAFPLHLPGVTASSPTRPILVVADAENVTTEFEPVEPDAVRPLAAGVRDRVVLPTELAGLAIRMVRLAPGSHAFQVRVKPEQLHVETTSSVTARLQDRTLQVVQQIDYEVAFDRLSEVRLMVPEELQDKIKFSLSVDPRDTPIELVAAWAGVSIGSLREASVRLDEARKDTFRIIAEYDRPVDDVLAIGPVVSIVIPLVTSHDAEFSSTRFQLVDSVDVEAIITGETWTKELGPENRPVWRADRPVTQVGLSLRRSTDLAAADISVERAAIVTVLESSGRAQSTGRYHIRGNISTLVLQFPAGVICDRHFRWDGQPVELFRDLSTKSGTYRLDLSRFDPSTTHLLEVEFHSETTHRGGWLTQAYAFSAPEFPAAGGIVETLWQIHLPIGQHLLTSPTAYTPQFRWEWQRLMFSRVTRPEFEQIGGWLLGSNRLNVIPENARGNVYTFTCFGPPRTLAFSSMSQWAIVFLGAGLSLGIGLVLLYIPITRHVLTILVVAFAIAVAGLWSSEPVELLLQPAALGLALAVAAAMLHQQYGRRRPPGVFSLPSPLDLLGVETRRELDAPTAGGIEPATAIYPAADETLEPASTSSNDTGSDR